MHKPKILGIIGSTRKNGFTHSLLNEAICELSGECDVEVVNLYSQNIKPCLGCFKCMKNGSCIQKDSMGENGSLYKKIRESNGLIIATPVYHWTYNSVTHTFIERLYPTHWKKFVNGIPTVCITCASNQGFQTKSLVELCKISFALNLKYIDGIDCHAALLNEEKKRARLIGKKLFKAVLEDSPEAREKFDEKSKWLHYMNSVWDPFSHYLANLTDGRFEIKKSLPEKMLELDDNDEIVENYLNRCIENLSGTLDLLKNSNRNDALESLLNASINWTKATWEKVVKNIVNMEIPDSYRGLND